jgi:orotate phosphoribosyltransferase
MLEWLGLILGVLGLFGIGGLIRIYDRSIGRWWLLRTWTPQRVKDETTKLVRNHIVEFKEPQNVASFGPDIRVKYFVDLLSAVTTGEGKRLLERCVLRWIRLNFDALPDKIAVPKLGNVILAESVASWLAVPLVIVRQESNLFIRGGHPLEGKLASDDRVLLLDDVASDGEFLARCVSHIEDFSAKVVGVLCVVNRTDANAERVLGIKGIKLMSILQMSDEDMAENSEKGMRSRQSS